MMKLSVELEKWRIDRPDEWKMDEFVRNAQKLEAERNALAAKLKTAESMHLDNVRHIWESRNCGSCEELAEKHDALAATVDRISTFIKLSAKKWEGVPEVEPTFWNLLRVANESPQQHLRDVRAEAGRAGFIAGYNQAQSDPFTANDTEIDLYADEYAESVKAGEE